MYCDITPDKRYQLADWRIRPLPAEMLHYARMDTHYLLYIYDELRNALLDHKADLVPEGSLEPHSPFREMLARSATTALRTHVREPYDAETGAGPGGWDNLARKWNKGALTAAAPLSPGSVGAMQREVFKRAHAWRDTIAREEDESTRLAGFLPSTRSPLTYARAATCSRTTISFNWPSDRPPTWPRS
jgi:exosome complex exonuclease RRP6